MPKDFFKPSDFDVDKTTINRFMLALQYAGASYDAGIVAGRTAGEEGQDPPVAVDISALVEGLQSSKWEHLLFEEPRREKLRDEDIGIISLLEEYYPLPIEKQDPRIVRKSDLKGRESESYLNPLIRTKSEEENFPLPIPKDTEHSAIDDLLTVRGGKATGELSYSEPVDTTSKAYKAGVVVGYVDGLTAYAAAQNLLRGSMTTPTALFAEHTWQAYARGLALESPGKARETPSRKEYLFVENEAAHEADFRAVDAQRAAGYSLGFAVRIAREYGVALDATNTPCDNESYTAFMRGLHGEPDVVRQSSPARKDDGLYIIPPTLFEGTFFDGKKINQIRDPLSDLRLQEEISAFVYQGMYRTGVRVREAREIE